MCLGSFSPIYSEASSISVDMTSGARGLLIGMPFSSHYNLSVYRVVQSSDTVQQAYIILCIYFASSHLYSSAFYFPFLLSSILLKMSCVSHFFTGKAIGF